MGGLNAALCAAIERTVRATRIMQVNAPCCGVLTCLLATASVNLSVSTTSRTHDSPTTPLQWAAGVICWR